MIELVSLLWQLAITSQVMAPVEREYVREVLTDFAPYTASSVLPANFCDAVVVGNATAILLDGDKIARWNLSSRQRETDLLTVTPQFLENGTDRIRTIRLIADPGGKRFAFVSTSGVVAVLPTARPAGAAETAPIVIRLDVLIVRAFFVSDNRLLVISHEDKQTNLPSLFVYKLTESTAHLESQTELNFQVESVVWDTATQKCLLLRKTGITSTERLVPTSTVEFELDEARTKRYGRAELPRFMAGSVLSPVRNGDYCVGQFRPRPGLWINTMNRRLFLHVPVLPSLYMPLHPTDPALNNVMWSADGRSLVADMGPAWNGCLIVTPAPGPTGYQIIKKPTQATRQVREHVAAIANNGRYVLCYECDGSDDGNKLFRWIIYERTTDSSSMDTRTGGYRER